MFRLIKSLIRLIILVILALVIILIFNPWNLRTRLVNKAIEYYFNTNQTSTEIKSIDNNTSTETNIIVSSTQDNLDKNPLLNAEQEATLESWGIDVAILPTEISPEMKACLVEKIGEERITAITAGSKPSALELFKAKGCL